MPDASPEHGRVPAAADGHLAGGRSVGRGSAGGRGPDADHAELAAHGRPSVADRPPDSEPSGDGDRARGRPRHHAGAGRGRADHRAARPAGGRPRGAATESVPLTHDRRPRARRPASRPVAPDRPPRPRPPSRRQFTRCPGDRAGPRSAVRPEAPAGRSLTGRSRAAGVVAAHPAADRPRTSRSTQRPPAAASRSLRPVERGSAVAPRRSLRRDRPRSPVDSSAMPVRAADGASSRRARRRRSAGSPPGSPPSTGEPRAIGRSEPVDVGARHRLGVIRRRRSPTRPCALPCSGRTSSARRSARTGRRSPCSGMSSRRAHRRRLVADRPPVLVGPHRPQLRGRPGAAGPAGLVRSGRPVRRRPSAAPVVSRMTEPIRIGVAASADRPPAGPPRAHAARARPPIEPTGTGMSGPLPLPPPAPARPDGPAVVRRHVRRLRRPDRRHAAVPAEHPGFTTVQLQPATSRRRHPTPEPTPRRPHRRPRPPAPAAAAPPAAARRRPPGRTADLDEMARRLFEPLSARLRAELWLDRERAGLVTDARH